MATGTFIIDGWAFSQVALTYSHTCKHSTRGIHLKPLMQSEDLGKLVSIVFWAIGPHSGLIGSGDIYEF